MKHEFIDLYRLKHRVKKMCEALKVHESGYYQWLKQTPGRKEIEDQQIVAEIREMEAEHYNTYRAKRVQQELLKRGIWRIYRLMSKNGIYLIHRGKYRPYPKEMIEARFSDIC